MENVEFGFPLDDFNVQGGQIYVFGVKELDFEVLFNIRALCARVRDCNSAREHYNRYLIN